MNECLGLRNSKVKKDVIFYLMQSSTIIPVCFAGNEINQTIDGLIVYHDILTDRKIFNAKAIGFRTVALGYLDNPTVYVFRSAKMYEVTDNSF